MHTQNLVQWNKMKHVNMLRPPRWQYEKLKSRDMRRHNKHLLWKCIATNVVMIPYLSFIFRTGWWSKDMIILAASMIILTVIFYSLRKIPRHVHGKHKRWHKQW